jgi:hypothetical protein
MRVGVVLTGVILLVLGFFLSVMTFTVPVQHEFFGIFKITEYQTISFSSFALILVIIGLIITAAGALMRAPSERRES